MADVSSPRILPMHVETVPVEQVQPHPDNPNQGDETTIRSSLDVNGQYRPVVAQRSSGNILAGNTTYRAARTKGATEVSVQWLDVDDEQAKRIMLVDNGARRNASSDERLLAEILADLPDLDGTGYSLPDLDSLEHSLASPTYDEDRSTEYDEGTAAPPEKRTMPLDLIFSWRPDTALGLIAAQMGWGLGCISTAVQGARTYHERYPKAPRITFMDNEWHGYDHTVHRDAVAEIKPVYATVRDLVTREQAQEQDVEWYSVEHTLDMAAEIAEHTDNIILIPKYDCLDKLPETINGARVVLGYSVPSSYGGTPLPIKAMQGRPIHLLGGPWKTQRAYLNLMRDDVVSLDNNHICNIAQWANVTMPSGQGRGLDDLINHPVHQAFYAAAVCSLASIASAVIEDYGVRVDPAQITAPEPAGQETRS